MLRVGLTGGIGSGKSAVSRFFEDLGVPVSDADVIAHTVTSNHHPALEQVAAAFGEKVIDADGNLDRDRMRQIVFDNPEERKRLESILHPIIRETMKDEVESFTAPYCLLVIPLLVEGDKHPLVDLTLVVDAPDEARIEWIKSRSGLTEERIRSIFKAQATREQRLAAADLVIENTGTLKELQKKTLLLHETLLAKSTS